MSRQVLVNKGMRAIEIFQDHQDLEEGWKDLAAAGILGTALATSGIGKSPAMARSSGDQTIEVPSSQHSRASTEQPGIGARAIRPATNHPNELVLMQEALRQGINGIQLAQLMAQARHESENFTRLVERGTTRDFNRYDPRYNPERARILGNTRPGDGARYRGRGYLHITGKYWYQRIGDALGIDLVSHPELMARPDIAAKTSIWFWQNQVMRRGVDPSNTQAVTRIIHPGLRALDQRIGYYADYIQRRN